MKNLGLAWDVYGVKNVHLLHAYKQDVIYDFNISLSNNLINECRLYFLHWQTFIK